VTRKEHQPHRGSTKTAYKWLQRGAVDPDGGFEWTIGPAPRTGPVTALSTAVHAYLPPGLPYEVDDELWEVVLQDRIGYQPFPHQRTEGGHHRFEEQEHSIVALSGYLVRRIQSWTPQVANEFARECALEARGRALSALHDAAQVLEEAQAAEQMPHGSKPPEPSNDVPQPAPEPEVLQREAVIHGHAERLLSIWRSAREAVGSPAQIASAYAEAAATSRAAAALTYASAIDPGQIDAAMEATSRAYAEERRRQARWLQERLGLQEQNARAVALDVA
jgi:hypothetical protein